MSLTLPPWRFTRSTESFTVLDSNLGGTAFTPGVSNADGTPVTVLSALAHDVELLTIGLHSTGGASVIFKMLADILIDPAGGTSWQTLISWLGIGGLGSAGYSSGNLDSLMNVYAFPIWIKAGSSVGLRARTSHTAASTCYVLMQAFGQPTRPDAWWCGQGVETIGVTGSTSTSTLLSPAVSTSWGTWTNVGSTTTRRWGALQVSYNAGDNIGAVAQHSRWQVRAGTDAGLGQMPEDMETSISINTGETTTVSTKNGVVFCDIPAGTQMQMRGMSQSDTKAHHFGIYGVY